MFLVSDSARYVRGMGDERQSGDKPGEVITLTRSYDMATIKEKIEDAGEATKEAAAKAGQKVKEAADKTAEKAAEAADAAGDAMKKTGEKLKENSGN